MQQLREFSQQENIISFINEVSEQLNDSLQGIQIGYDNFWLKYYYYSSFKRFPFPYFFRNFREYKYMYDNELQLNLKPNNWDAHCNSLGYPKNASPIYIKFILKKASINNIKIELPYFYNNYPVLYEERSPAVIYKSNVVIQPASTISQIDLTNKGSAGGFLQHPKLNKKYLISCAHVLGNTGNEIYSIKKGFFKDKIQNKIGKVVLHCIPDKMPKQSNCNKKSNVPKASIDLGVVDIDKDLNTDCNFSSLGIIDTMCPIKNMTPYDNISFFGQQSGIVNGRIGSLHLWHIININDQPTCFHDLFAINKVSYVHNNFAKPGDSGAWILNNSNNVLSWDGMLIGADDVSAYCCFAENIQNYIHTKFDKLILPT